MRNIIVSLNRKWIALSLFAAALFANVMYAYAQESPDVKVNGQDVGSWFSRYWIWVVGAVVLLLLIIIFSSKGSNRSKRTTSTVTRDNFGDVRSSSTTTETESE